MTGHRRTSASEPPLQSMHFSRITLSSGRFACAGVGNVVLRSSPRSGRKVVRRAISL